MKRSLRFSFILCLLLVLPLPCFAQEAEKQKKVRDNFFKDLHTFLNMRADKAYTKLDSNYIGRYPYHWGVRLFYTSTGMSIVNEGVSNIHLTTGMNHRIGLGVTYQGLNLTYSRAIGQKFNFNLAIDSYGKNFSVEYALRFTTGLNGTVMTPDAQTPDLKNLILGESRLNLLYSFNPRFSYAAAMRQTKIQRRSAGSFMAAVSWTAWDVIALRDLEGGEIPEIPDASYRSLIYSILASNMFYNRISVGAGYGYNWVLGHQRWLLHASLVPMWSVYEATTVRENKQRNYYPYPNGWISFSATARAGIYYRWGDRWSLGLSGVVNQMESRNHLSSKRIDFTRFGAQDWYIRLSLDVRFGKK